MQLMIQVVILMINRSVVLGGFFLLLLFGCVGSKTETRSNPLESISDSDIAISDSPTDPLLIDENPVVSESEYELVENDTLVFSESDLVLSGEDLLIEPE